MRVLRQIGFVDANGVPQPAWREYRGADHRRVLGRALVLGYETLYATYPDAHSRPAVDLAHVFSSKTDAGKQAIDKTVTTFKNLVKEADFDALPTSTVVSTGGGPPPSRDSDVGGEPDGDGRGGNGRSNVVTRQHVGGGVTINVNVQLTLPETQDEKVFDAFFSAMRRHLIDDSSS